MAKSRLLELGSYEFVRTGGAGLMDAAGRMTLGGCHMVADVAAFQRVSGGAF